MRLKNQFTASLKKEWLKVVRERKLAIYLVVTFGFILINIALQGFFNSSAVSGLGGDTASWYTSVTGFNGFVLGVNMVLMLFLNREEVSLEIREKKMQIAFSMGLKPSVNIIAKYIVQVLVPAFICFFASLINVLLSVAFFENISVDVGVLGIVSVDFAGLIISSVCVFVSVMVFLVVQLSFDSLFRNSNLALTVTLAILIFGDSLAGLLNINLFSPTAFYNYALYLAKLSSTTQIILSSLTTFLLLTLLMTSSVLVYSDRN